MQDLDKEKMSLEMEVAERIKAEERLTKSRDFAESLFHSAPAIVVILDITGRIIRFNPYMEKISGYTVAEVKGMRWSDVFSPEKEGKSITELFSDNTENKTVLGNISSIVAKSGDRRKIMWFDSPLKDLEEKTTGLLAVGQDITGQLELQKEVIETKKKEAVARFIGSTADDLNNLFKIIEDVVDRFSADADKGNKSEYLDEIRKAVRIARALNLRIISVKKDN